jgi:hypothetical protein
MAAFLVAGSIRSMNRMPSRWSVLLHAAGQRGAADDLHRVAAVGEAAGHGVLPPFDVVV